MQVANKLPVVATRPYRYPGVTLIDKVTHDPKFPTVQLDPRDLLTTQTFLDTDKAAHIEGPLRQDKPIIVVRFEGKMYVEEGNHRAAHALATGQPVPAKIIDGQPKPPPDPEDEEDERPRRKLHEAAVPKVDAPRHYAAPVESLLAAGMSQGSDLLCTLAAAAVKRLVAMPPHEIAAANRLFTDEELTQLAGELAAVRMSGDLLGRSLLQDHAERVRKRRRVTESLRESKDASGHEHASDGRFGTQAGSHDKPTKPDRKTVVEKLHRRAARESGKAYTQANQGIAYARKAADSLPDTAGSLRRDLAHVIVLAQTEQYGAAYRAAQPLLYAALADEGRERAAQVDSAFGQISALRGALQAAHVASQTAEQYHIRAYKVSRRADKRRDRNAVTESVYGNSHRPLTVPTVLQSLDYSCGRAALQSVLDAHGVPVDNARLGAALGTDPDDGTQPEALVDAAAALGLPYEVRDGANLDDLAHAIDRGAPCICCVQRNGGGHWVVVTGVTGGTVSTMDPLDGQRTEPAADFVARWWDTAHGVRYERWALAVGAPAVRESRLHARLQEAQGVPALQPEAALDFFRSLVPTLGTDPLRLADGRRQAFTLAAATDEELLQAVKDTLAEFLAQGRLDAVGADIPGRGRVTFTPHERAGGGEVLVMVDPQKLDAAWRQDASYYIPTTGAGASEVKGRREGFLRFLDTGKPIQAPRAGLDAEGNPYFTDGRHRFAVLRDLGASHVGVVVPADQAADFRQRFAAATPPPGLAREPTAVIAGLLDAAGVSPANPQYAEAVMRTNVLDAFNTGLHDEMQREKDTFPSWEWSNPHDGRSRPTHAARDGRYYPAERSLQSIRDVNGFDGFNCRCVPVPLDKWTWQELVDRGAAWSQD